MTAHIATLMPHGATLMPYVLANLAALAAGYLFLLRTGAWHEVKNVTCGEWAAGLSIIPVLLLLLIFGSAVIPYQPSQHAEAVYHRGQGR